VNITAVMERVMANKTGAILLGLVSIIAPLYFLKTLYVVWFGPTEIFVGFQSERSTWFILATVDAVAFLTTLPAREKGRIIQIVMGLWTIEMSLIFLATVVR